MKLKKLIFATTLIGLLIFDHGLTQSLEEQIDKCAKIEVSLIRLQCFDRLSKEPQIESPSEDKEPRFRLFGRNTERTSPPKKESVSEIKPPAPRVESAAITNVESSESDFGKEVIIAKEDTDKISSRIMGQFKGWTGKTQFELENGQVWEQSGNGILSIDIQNPNITIKRGVFGSYTLNVEGVNSSVKVKRIK